jgi:hypothetical protein
MKGRSNSRRLVKRFLETFSYPVEKDTAKSGMFLGFDSPFRRFLQPDCFCATGWLSYFTLVEVLWILTRLGRIWLGVLSKMDLCAMVFLYPFQGVES